MPNTLTRIFFSYSRSDSNFVLKVARALRNEGRSIWVDQLDIPKGARWDVEVEKALKASHCMLVVLSPASTTSQNVLDEVSYALEEGRKVLPILLQPTNIPFRLKRLQYIDFTGNFDTAYKQLVAALDNLPTTGSMIQPVPAVLAGGAAAAAPPASAPIVTPPAPVAAPPAPAIEAAAPRRRSMAAILVLLSLVLLLLLGGAYWLYAKMGTLPRSSPGSRPTAEVAVTSDNQSGKPSTQPVEPIATTGQPATQSAATVSDEQLRAFVDAYIHAQNQASATALLDFYGDRIDYFDRADVGKDFVMRDKKNFYKRWPQAENQRISEVEIDRLPNEPAARISYLINFRVHDPERSTTTWGRAREYMMLRFDDGRVRIVAQRQEIVQSGAKS